MDYTLIGTSNFVGFFAACMYYADYGLNAEKVKAKIEAGDIAIGEPPHKPELGESVYVDRDGRYIKKIERIKRGRA